MYSCATCGGPVEVIEGVARPRACGHDGDGIVASLEAKVTGVGGADQDPPTEDPPAQ